MTPIITVPKRKDMILVFDTETTGLPPRRNSGQPFDINRQPCIAQLSAEMYSISENKVVESLDVYIRLPDGVDIPEEATNIHGITRTICDEKGVDIIDALIAFYDMYQHCETYVGHNLPFDKRMVYTEVQRNRLAIQERAPQCLSLFNEIYEKTKNIDSYCTMQQGRRLCNIQRINEKTGRPFIKFPKLIELYSHLFPLRKSPENLHNSAVDIQITLACYLKMRHNYEEVNEVNEVNEIPV